MRVIRVYDFFFNFKNNLGAIPFYLSIHKFDLVIFKLNLFNSLVKMTNFAF